MTFPIPKIPKVTSAVVCKFKCRLYEYHHAECVRHLNVRIGGHTVMSTLTEKQVRSKNSFISDICYFAIIHLYLTLLFLTRENSQELGKPVNKDRSESVPIR